jgi:hypothetical protein
MAMLVERHGVRRDLVVREGHVLGVEEASTPTWKRFSRSQLGCVDEGHAWRIFGHGS